MSELESYDNAIEKLVKIAEGTVMPLHSWDFFATNYDAVKASLFDANQLQELAQENHWLGNWNFSEQLQDKKTIVVTDSKLTIVFASQNILQMSGYQNNEVIGNSPKMFQGEATSKEDLSEIRAFIGSQKPFEKTIVNYKKNGETYLCKIEAFPVFNSKKQLVNFIAFERAA